MVRQGGPAAPPGRWARAPACGGGRPLTLRAGRRTPPDVIGDEHGNRAGGRRQNTVGIVARNRRRAECPEQPPREHGSDDAAEEVSQELYPPLVHNHAADEAADDADDDPGDEGHLISFVAREESGRRYSDTSVRQESHGGATTEEVSGALVCDRERRYAVSRWLA